MIRSIRQRILVAFVPLALLAVALVIFNGVSRIDDANREVEGAQSLAADLLHQSAMDALVVGNTIDFERIIGDLTTVSDTIECVALSDLEERLVARAGSCETSASETDFYVIDTAANGFSDYPDEASERMIVGRLRVSMSRRDITAKQRLVVYQLLFSLLLILALAWAVARFLRTRLIQPIERIDSTMEAVANRDYQARIDLEGDDEFARLSRAIDTTIETISNNIVELEHRREDAESAVHFADESNLARAGLIRSLIEDLDGPLGLMHSELTAIAIANNNLELRDRIKQVMARLQDTQFNFQDLIEVANGVQQPYQPRSRDLGEIMADMQRDIRALTDTEQFPVHFVVTQTPLSEALTGEPTGIFLDIDSVRLKKALINLIRAVGRRCKDPGVFVNAELIKLDAQRLHIAIHLKAFFDTRSRGNSDNQKGGPQVYSDVPPSLLSWTDRESRMIDYLLRTVGIAPTYSVTPDGTINVLLDTSCAFRVQAHGQRVSTDWIFGPRPVSTIFVTNDTSLSRLTNRSDVANHDVQLMPFSEALANPQELYDQDALLIDMTEDVASAVSVVEQIRARGTDIPQLIAVCPSGPMSDDLGDRFFELGLTGVLQKPLHFGRVLEVVRTTLANPLQSIVSDYQKD